jgi:hypothetical protein
MSSFLKALLVEGAVITKGMFYLIPAKLLKGPEAKKLPFMQITTRVSSKI